MKIAYLAGGCFWCIESDLIKREGVFSVVSGYMGGTKETANYDDVCTGQTLHREVVKVIYDEEIINYNALVDYFFTCIDPTNPYGQFADIGPQYKTAIYYSDETEEKIALSLKKLLDESKRFTDPIVTDILRATEFYEAEVYHQEYYKKQPIHYENYRIGSGRSGFIKLIWGDKH
ncbi:MAG: peptide-methionine (S)-S-oxide reductase MsrA [Clostridiales bacterium]|nr:peptide-methionine (S)-S-oxide reductase MsrA [Clostridiales bacterium]